MTKKIPIQKMLSRLKEITQQIATLEQEQLEIVEALKVLKRYSMEAVSTQTQKVGARRPPDAPTNLEMTRSILLEAGASGLTGAELVKAIERRFWPGVSSRQILPAIYKFAKDGKLRREAGRFYIAKEPLGLDAP
jgi:hypothetical protein